MTPKGASSVSSCNEQHNKKITSITNNIMSTARLRRMRSMLVMTSLPLVSGMVVTSRNTNANSQMKIKPSQTMKKIEELRKNNIQRENVVRRGLFGDADTMKGEFLDLFDDMQKEDDEEVSMSALVSSQNITCFQAATGSEVLNIELHLQIEAARRRREADAAFIESHVEDASPAEKLAMKMIPMQLPYPAAKLSETKHRIKNLKIKTRTSKNKKLLTQEKEIELANLIRKGAQLQSIKTEFERTNSRSITRAEWTQLAGLDSPSTLRRLISTYRQAKSQLVTANMGLVYAVVRQQQQQQQQSLKKTNSALSEEELVQEGSLGLIRAAELFDPERGLRFSTYATIWIKGVLGNAKVDQLIKIPDREQRKWNKINKLLKERAEWYGVRLDDVILEGRADEDSSHKSHDLSDLIINEVALSTGMTPETIISLRHKMAQSRHILSLDYKYQSQSRSGTPDDSNDNRAESQLVYNTDRAFLSDESLSEMLQLRADVVATLAKNLDPREARLMRLRYGLTDGTPRTMRECAEAMGLSRQRVQQLASNCLKKLRAADDAESLQEYLLTIA